jgi:hypothetical protein
MPYSQLFFDWFCAEGMIPQSRISLIFYHYYSKRYDGVNQRWVRFWPHQKWVSACISPIGPFDQFNHGDSSGANGYITAVISTSYIMPVSGHAALSTRFFLWV